VRHGLQDYREEKVPYSEITPASGFWYFHTQKNAMSVGLLICTLISEKQGLEKSRSASNLRKISGPANLDFFLGLHLEKKVVLYYTPEKNPGDKLKKNLGVQDLKFF
jgi:hypothetical protein